MKNTIKTLVMFFVLLSLGSCYVNRATVGDGPIGKQDASVKFSKRKQMYVLWGLLPLKTGQAKVPVECGYQVKTSFNFWDALATTLTAGIFGMRTEKIMVRKDSQCDPAIKKLERKLEKKEMQEQH